MCGRDVCASTDRIDHAQIPRGTAQQRVDHAALGDPIRRLAGGEISLLYRVASPGTSYASSA